MTGELDDKAVEFLARIDRAIEVAKLSRDQLPEEKRAWLADEYETLIRNLSNTRRRVVEGLELRVSRGTRNYGSGTGMGRFLGEWCDDDDVLRACRSVEDYIRYEY